jgi:hypothetical protein
VVTCRQTAHARAIDIETHVVAQFCDAQLAQLKHDQFDFGFNALRTTGTNCKRATRSCELIDATNWNGGGNYFVAKHLQRNPLLILRSNDRKK